MSKKIIIPLCRNPFDIYVNHHFYSYPAGEEVEVPDEVAEVIEQHIGCHVTDSAPPASGGGGSYDQGYNDGFEAGKAEGSGSGGGLTPSEGLNYYDWISCSNRSICAVDMGNCTDTEVIIPAFSPEERYVVFFKTDGKNEMNIKSIIFPDSIREFEYVFGYTPNLEYIKFGKFTYSLGQWFSGSGQFASNLVLDFSDFANPLPPTNPTNEVIDFIKNNPDTRVRVPIGMLTVWQNDTNWNVVSGQIEGV